MITRNLVYIVGIFMCVCEKWPLMAKLSGPFGPKYGHKPQSVNILVLVSFLEKCPDFIYNLVGAILQVS